MKAVLIIPDGVGIRNFLCTPFIDHLLAEGEVAVWHGLPEAGIERFKKHWGSRVRWAILPPFREGLVERVLRLAKIDAQLFWHQKRDAGDAVFNARFGKRSKRRWQTRLISTAAHRVGRYAGHEQGTIRLHDLHRRAAAARPHISAFESFLQAESPDVVFCTHQRASRAVPAMIAAANLGIPTATFVYSWDNLPKGRMAVHADHFLVWSSHMKEEMRRYYPDVADERVHVVGTPQFEHYFNASFLEPRDGFLRRFGLDPSRPVVCFSGDDVTTSPFDPVYLEDLARGLRKVRGEQRPQILFRRCPTDRSTRYDATLARYPDIAVSDPQWLSPEDGDWTGIIPTFEDVALLVNVVAHCDAVVNLGSTMAADFAIMDKPAVFVNYDPVPDTGGWHVRDIYRYPHFRELHKLKPVHWAHSPEELATVVQHVLNHPEEKACARQAWLQHLALHPLDEASLRCSAALVAISTPETIRQRACTLVS